MALADVLDLVAELSNGEADPTLAQTFYTDAINELADKHYLTKAALLSPVATQTELSLPADLRSLIRICYENHDLSEMTLRELEHHDPRWRLRSGRPRAYTRETETAKTIAWFPTPDITAAPYVPPAPMFGIGYPAFSAVAFYSGFRDPVPALLELIIVFWILAREYGRESNHQNPQWQAFAMNMVDILYQMVEY